MKIKVLLLALLQFLMSSSSFAWYEEYKTNLLDLTDHSITNEQKVLAKSVGSISYKPGRFILKVEDEHFWDKKVDNRLRSIKGDFNFSYYFKNRSYNEKYGWHHKLHMRDDVKFESFRSAGLEIEFYKYDFEVDVSLKPGESHCTGFLVQENVFITNRHCIATQEKCEKSVVRFNEEKVESGEIGEIKGFSCKKLIASDPVLDISIISLEGTPGLDFGYLKLSNRLPSLKKTVSKWKVWPFVKNYYDVPAENLYTIGHPGGHPDYPEGMKYNTIKKVSKKCNAITNSSLKHYPTYSSPNGQIIEQIDWYRLLVENVAIPKFDKYFVFKTNCPLAGGMSGSPLFDLGGNVIGLFNSGTEDWILQKESAPVSYTVPMFKVIEKYRELFYSLNVDVIDSD